MIRLPFRPAQGDQDASGVGVSPERVWNTMVVSSRISDVACSSSQRALLPASKTRDRKMPSVAYGLIRAQSTTCMLPSAEKSLNSGRMTWAGGLVCVATRPPSM